ncbi:MAG: carbamoyltransferase HypF [Dechloromonas sp.]|nr:carbamoyltransferase HypF [Dechloromonas sp.]
MASQRIRVRGLVQGVGFRPYIWRLARELDLAGWVRNDGEGVEIAACGDPTALKALLDRLPGEAPPLARIDAIEAAAANDEGFSGFAILDSGSGAVATAIGPDAAICPACLADLCDPANRRWRYAFTTCTHCGPRYTVSGGIPYDREKTSLAPFPLCAPCAAEYTDPADRRFHAETTCCPDCGPRLRLLDASGAELPGDAVAATLALLQAGKIVALKGLGGFQLACDARNAAAVAELRSRKQREEKPFAVMALNPVSLASFVRIGTAEAKLLADPAAPIVLCPKAEAELPGIAPGLAWLGAMLPATPLHLLLWHEAAGRPAGTAWREVASDLLLVMTSANPHGEPLVIANDEALQRLAASGQQIADAFLVHDRAVVVRCDDSVVRPSAQGPAFIRRARGYTPLPIPLAEDGPAVLAFGAYLKNTVCVAKGHQAFLSQHIGGLDNAAAIGFLEETVAHLLAILDVKPDLVAHDLHPDFPSTRLAQAFAAERGIPAIAVGHHHAHIGAIAAEHGHNGPLLGLALDGVGLGPDGGAWGGELLRVDGADCQRLGHLAPLGLPGGDRAAREPWRMAVSALHAGGHSHRIGAWLARRHPGHDAGPLLTMLARDLRCPPSSSLGRLFDAAAGLLGTRAEARYEGQAAMELEGLATAHGVAEALAGGIRLTDNILDFAPLLSFLADFNDAARGAAVFHATVVRGLADWVVAAAQKTGLVSVACGGGCAMNAILMAALRGHLEDVGLTLLEARRAPPNDGGLALGQAWVARRLSHGSVQ